MKFITENFLLRGKTAKRLYHEVAATIPIIDYHCHLDARDISQNTSFGNITNVWIDNDHYKWTAMRCEGIAERYITGDATDWEKFRAYAGALPACIGNPLHHWSHLELHNYFGYDGHLSGQSAREVWDRANERLSGMRARDFIDSSHVELICTTDDPADNLEWHGRLRQEGYRTRVLPAFRPDAALHMEQENFTDYMVRLGAVCGAPITGLDGLLQAMEGRLDYFAQHGCKLSDHGLRRIVFMPCSGEKADEILRRRLAGERVSQEDADRYTTFLLCWLAGQYAARGWVMQLHYGVLRDINPTLYRNLGVDAGGDAAGTDTGTDRLADLLGYLEGEEALPKTILYSINPNDNLAIATIAGCFQTAQARGKIQHGSAWWVNDTKLGMEQQLKNLAGVGVLGSFVGMLTDSRSFMSYARHEYFRRILCNYLGEMVESGEYPADWVYLEKLVRDICYENAKHYFQF